MLVLHKSMKKKQHCLVILVLEGNEIGKVRVGTRIIHCNEAPSDEVY